jgi:hypothetical protein
MYKINIFGCSRYMDRLQNKKINTFCLFCFGLQWYCNSDLQITYILKRLQGVHCPNLKYDEDIESMNETRTQQRGNRRLRSSPDSAIFRQKEPELMTKMTVPLARSSSDKYAARHTTCFLLPKSYPHKDSSGYNASWICKRRQRRRGVAALERTLWCLERGVGWIGSLQISETNAVVKTFVGTTDAVPELPRGRYFRYRAGTTDRSEMTKTKFEM